MIISSVSNSGLKASTLEYLKNITGHTLQADSASSMQSNELALNCELVSNIHSKFIRYIFMKDTSLEKNE
jgi:hypothetical protein